MHLNNESVAKKFSMPYKIKQELMNQWIPEDLFNPLWVIFIPSVTFEPLCILNFMQNIIKTNGTILGNYQMSFFYPFFGQTRIFQKNPAASLLSVYGPLTS